MDKELELSFIRLVLRLTERTLFAPEKFSVASTKQLATDYRNLKKYFHQEKIRGTEDAD